MKFHKCLIKRHKNRIVPRLPSCFVNGVSPVVASSSCFVFEIRQYVDSDQAAVRRLHDEALAATGAHLGPGPWDDDLAKIAESYLEAGGDFVVGLLGGELVAMGALRRIDDLTAEIKRMRVAPSFQRRGFGRSILQRLEARARQLGYRRLRLDTTERQKAARTLYERSGFIEVDRRPGQGGSEDIIHEKAISRLA